VYNSKLCIAGSLVAVLSLCRKLGLPNTQQMVLHFPRGLQRGHLLVPRTIQDIHLCLQSYSLHRSAHPWINWCGVIPTGAEGPIKINPPLADSTGASRFTRYDSLNTSVFRLTTIAALHSTARSEVASA